MCGNVATVRNRGVLRSSNARGTFEFFIPTSTMQQRNDCATGLSLLLLAVGAKSSGCLKAVKCLFLSCYLTSFSIPFLICSGQPPDKKREMREVTLIITIRELLKYKEERCFREPTCTRFLVHALTG